MKPAVVAGGFQGGGKAARIVVAVVDARLVYIGGAQKGTVVVFQNKDVFALFRTVFCGVQALESGTDDDPV